MKFERIHKKLDTLTGIDDIGADDIFDAVSLLLSDIFEENSKGNNINDYKIGNEDVYITSLLKTINVANSSYAGNIRVLERISERRKRRFETAMADIGNAEKELSLLRPIIEESEKAESDLKTELELINREKAEKARLEKSIQQLENEIENLNSVSIEDLRKEERQQSDEKRKKESELQALRDSIASLSDDVHKLEESISKNKKIKKEREDEKALFEAEESEILKELEEYPDWKKSFQARQEQTTEDRNQLVAICNAWNAANRRPDLPDLLKESGEFKAFDRTISGFTEIKEWFDDMQRGLTTCMKVYENAYKTVLSAINQEEKNDL